MAEYTPEVEKQLKRLQQAVEHFPGRSTNSDGGDVNTNIETVRHHGNGVLEMIDVEVTYADGCVLRAPSITIEVRPDHPDATPH